MYKIDLIIFDLDGTLVDSVNDIINSVNFTLKELGLDEKTPEEIKKYIGISIEDLLIQATEREDLYKRTHLIFKEHFTEHSLDTTVLYPGVKDMLRSFKDKTKVIVTNRKSYSADWILDVLGIKDFFVNVLGSDDVRYTKPHSCPIDKTLEKFGIKNKEKAIMVGDMTVDVEAGKAAGVLTCAVTYGIGAKEDIIKSDPDFVIDGIEELKRIII